MAARSGRRRGPIRRLVRRSPRLRHLARRVTDAATYVMARCALAALGVISLERGLRLADRVGNLVYALLRGTRRRALDHIEFALGDTLTATAREEAVRASFRNIARCFCEVAKFDLIRKGLDEYVEIDGFHHLQRAAAERGAIAVTGHIGNWELLAAYCALKGIPVAAIARNISNERLNTLLVNFRARHNVHTILRESKSSTRQMLRTLRNGGILAMLIDQDTRAPSVSVPFFGRPARTPAAAAALAIRRNLPAIAVVAERRPEGGHRLTILPPLSFEPTGKRKTDVINLTRRFNELLEAQIRKNPSEWVWWHRRWRHAPIPEMDLDATAPSR